MAHGYHADLTGEDIHVPYAWSYADTAEREGATGFVAGDVGKLALQEDDNSLWILTAVTPTWESVADAGGAVVDAADVTYTPTVATDWDSDADPGDVDDALDQLAERVTDNEGSFASYLPLSGGTMSGELVVADQLVTRPKLKDYGEAVNAIGSIGGGAQTIDLELGNVVTATVDTSETTFTFSNPSASGTACSFTLILTNGGSQTVNWPASVDWPGGVEPTLTTAGVDILVFMTTDGGTTWYGMLAGWDMG